MSMGNSLMHENSKDSEATLGIYNILDKENSGGMGPQISDVRTGDFQEVGEEWTHVARKFLLGSSGAMRHRGS